jgi:copper chaperone CopZ
MKLKFFSLIAMFLFGATAVFAGNKTETFKVFGNCGMCKARIEKAAKSVEGVSTATWNKETKMIEVTFDESKTNVHKIQEAIAEVGHDTEMHKATDETYDNLPGCCKYDRPTNEKNTSGHKH